MIQACTTKPASASTRQAGSPQRAPTRPPSAAPIGRAPVFTVRKIADTRPSMAPGVTVWRNVVEVITQIIGPTPNRKKATAANTPLGNASVATIVSAASTEITGPSWIARPNGSRATTRDVSSAPTIMPTPYAPSVMPTSPAVSPSFRTA